MFYYGLRVPSIPRQHCRLLFHVLRHPDGIYKTNLADGERVQQIISKTHGMPYGITVSSSTERIYWTSQGE